MGGRPKLTRPGSNDGPSASFVIEEMERNLANERAAGRPTITAETAIHQMEENLQRERASHYIPDPRAVERGIAESAGIGLQGAPAKVRAIASFDPEQRIDVITAAFKAATGNDVGVRIGPETGKPEYQDPETLQWDLFDPPGSKGSMHIPDAGDWASLTGAALTFAGEIAGFAAGAPAKSPTLAGVKATGTAGVAIMGGAASALDARMEGASGMETAVAGAKGAAKYGAAFGLLTSNPVTGAGVGAAIGHYVRLKIGRDYFGLNENATDSELSIRAVKEAGLWATGGALVGNFVMKLIASRAQSKLSALARHQIEFTDGQGKRLVREIEETEEVAKAIRSKISDDAAYKEAVDGRGFGYTVGQATSGSYAGKPLYALERELMESPEAQGPISQILDDQFLAFQAYFRNINKNHGLSESSKDGGYEIARTWQESIRYRLDRINEGASIMQQRARDVAKGKVRARLYDAKRAGSEYGSDLGVITRGEITEKNMLISEGYAEIDVLAKGVTGSEEIPLGFIRRKVKETLGDIKLNVFDDLDEVDRTFLQNVSKKINTADDGGTMPTISFGELTKTLQVLRRQQRISNAMGPGTPTPTDHVFNELIHAVTKTRLAFSAKSPPLRNKIGLVEADVAKLHEHIDRSVLGRMLKVDKTGRQAIPDEKMFATIFRGSERDAYEVSRLMRRDRSLMTPEDAALHDEVWHRTRQGILDMYDSTVLHVGKRIDDFPDPARHDKFMKDYGERIKHFFTNEELDEVKKLRDLAPVVEATERRSKQIMDWAKRGQEARLEKLTTPTDVFNRVWTKGDRGQTAHAVALSSSDPILKERFRQVVFNDMSKYMGVDPASAPGIQRYDFVKLKGYLQKRAGQLEEVMGEEYVKDLRVLSEAVTRAYREPPGKALAGVAKMTSFERVANHLARAYVGLFTRKGRAMTAAIVLRAKTAEGMLAEMMTNPTALKEQLKLAGPEYVDTVLPWFSSMVAMESFGDAGVGRSDSLERRERAAALPPFDQRAFDSTYRDVEQQLRDEHYERNPQEVVR